MRDPSLITPAHHLVAHPGDLRTVCGLDTRKPEGWPYLLRKHLTAHVEGHRRAGRLFAVCPNCEKRHA